MFVAQKDEIALEVSVHSVLGVEISRAPRLLYHWKHFEEGQVTDASFEIFFPYTSTNDRL